MSRLEGMTGLYRRDVAGDVSREERFLLRVRHALGWGGGLC